MEEDSKTSEQEKAKFLLDLTKSYNEEREKKLGELPFFYNILEEVRVNENAHTRLLMRLLQYEPARTDFFKYLEGKGFASLTMSKPKITAEKYRIDGLIQEEGEYAIIIENKVCGAVDQEGQLGRYINECVGLGYTEKQIYILYLVDRPGTEPSLQTWGEYKEEDFGNRYLQLSYAGDIINWLDELLAKVQVDSAKKSNSLQAGIAQYLDYLRLMFKIDEYTKMKTKLTQYVEGELELTARFSSSSENAVAFLKEQQQFVADLSSELGRLLKYYQIKDWGEKIKVRSKPEQGKPIKLFISTEVGASYPKVGMHYQVKIKEEDSFVVLIEFDIEKSCVYVGLGCHQEAGELRISDLQNKFDSELEKVLDHGQYKSWYRWCEVKPDEAMRKFNELITALEEELGAKPVPAGKAEE